MVENFWLFGFVAAVFAVEWKFYDWHQPQIEVLDQRRWEEISACITQFLEAHPGDNNTPEFGETLHQFINELSSDKDLIFPVGGALNPHRKIFKCLMMAVILSAVYGLFSAICVLSAKGQVHFPISDPIQFFIKLVLAAVTFGPIGLAAWLGWTEFQYVLRIKERFSSRPSIGRHLQKSLKVGDISRAGTAIGAMLTSPQKTVDDGPIREIERLAITRLRECVSIVKKAKDEPVALYQLRMLQKSLTPGREQISLVRNDQFLLHADPATEKGPATVCWQDEASGSRPLYPGMKHERRGVKIARIKDTKNRVTAIAFDSLDKFDLLVIAEAHYYEDGLAVGTKGVNASV